MRLSRAPHLGMVGPMELAMQTLVEQIDNLRRMIELQLQLLIMPSRLIQVGIIVAVIGLAWLLRRATSERMRDWMRTLENRPKWQLRALLVINNRLQLIWFVVLMWLATWTMQIIHTFPSRYFILSLVATLVSAWLGVIFATRLVRNPILRDVVRWGLWIWVTLYYLGVTEEAATFADSLALEMGDFRLSLLTIVTAAVMIGLLFTGARFVTSAGAERIRKNDEISPSMRVLVVKVLQIVLYGMAVVLGLQIVGVDLTGLAVLSGAIGVGLGFGLQKVVSNLVSGVIILLDKSIKPGDVISLGETFGWISTLGARYASVVTRDGREYLIPNEDLITGQVVNWSHSDQFVRLDVYFGTSYADDPHMVRRVAIATASQVERVLSSRPPVCHIVGFCDSSVDYILRFWISDPSGGLTNIRGNIYLALWDAFQENDITFPFPQREVKILAHPDALPSGAEVALD